MRHTWTPAKDARLRRMWEAGRSFGDIAAALRVTAVAVKTRANRGLRLIRRRPFTAAEVRVIRREYGGTPCKALAARLGRTGKSIYLKALAMGLTDTRFQWTAEAVATLKRMHAAGKSDCEIAAALGCNRHSVGDERDALGLAPWFGVAGCPWTPAKRAEVAERTRRQLERAGLTSIGQLRAASHAAVASKYNLPADLPIGAVRVVLALLSGPLTRRELAARLGLTVTERSRGMLKSNSRHGSYTADLMARDLVVYLPRYVRGQGKGGRVPGVYLLTPKCLDLLAAAGEVA